MSVDRRLPAVSGLLAVLVAALALLDGRCSRPDAGAPPAPVAAVDSTAPEPLAPSRQRAEGDAAAAALALRRATDLRGALESARRQLPGDSPMLRSLGEEARVACSIVRRPDASARRVESDPSRREWIDQLLRRCAGLTDADLAPPAPGAAALEAWNRQLPMVAALRESIAAGVALAQSHLDTSADPQLIAESLRFLLDQQELPLAAIFHGRETPVHADVEAALIPAADWIACERSQACGADGLWTLYTCAQFGCPAGSDLPRALYRILPPQQFEVAQRLVQWATSR